MLKRSRLASVALVAVGAALVWAAASGRLAEMFAQGKKPAGPATPVAETGTPLVLPRPDFQFKGKVGRTYLDSDKAQFPQPVQPPKGAPNVVLILLDDTGFGQYATFGGGVPSPTLDKLAAEGLKYNRFHTTALCSPTRAALITGRNHHSAATGVITGGATGYDGYTCVLPRSCGTVAEVLRQNGYVTAWIGKNHNTPAWETSAAGPFDRWANGLGFDYFYGFNAGDMNHWDPVLFENRNLVPRSADPNYHMTEDLADKAIEWTRKVTSIAPDKPFFLYVAPGANHSPHHAPKEWIDRFKGKFDGGWDAYREETLARQIKMGIVPPGTKLTARSEGLPAWNTLKPGQKKVYARMMEVFAGYAAHVDHHMGRIIDEVKKMPNADNTMFVYIVGDNGASAEGGLDGSLNENLFFNGFPEKWEDNLEHIDEIGGPKWFNHFPSAWAHAMNTPFQWTKQVASHFGGTRNPMIISWPARIKDKGGLRSQFLHVIDVVPTLYEATGITPPKVLNGIKQKPIEGASFLKSFTDKGAPETRKTQYFELLVNRGMYHDGWMASSRSFVPWAPVRGAFDPFKAKWELYDVSKDFSQAEDLAARHPEKVKELEALFWKEAEKYQVLPLDWRGTERLNAELQGRPSLTGKRALFTYYPGQVGLPDGACPPVLNKSFSVIADVVIPEAGAEGMVFTHGGLTGGYGLYLRGGKAHFVYNWLAIERFTVTSEPLPKGKVSLVVRVTYEGKPGELGKPATVTVTANGKKVGEGKLPRTVPLKLSLGEGLDVGMDLGSAVDFTYKLPFRFTGKIEKVTVELKSAHPQEKPVGQTPSLQDVIGGTVGKAGATTVYVAKEFLTMDPKRPRAEAVAVRDGRFVAVGSLADVRAAAGKDATVDRTFAGKVVIAGFVEQHVHPVLAALTMNTKVISIEDWDAIDGFSPAVREPKGYQERLKKALGEHPAKAKPFVTWGYHHYMHGELSRATLNKLAPDFPVIVWHRSCHEFFLNDAALKLTGIDDKLVAGFPKNVRDQISYEKGHFYEQGMMAVLDKVAPLMASPAAFKNGLEYTVRYYHRNGITTCCEPGGFVSRPVQDLINSVYSGDDVPFNHYFMVDGKTFAARHPRDAKALVADSEQVLAWGKGRTAYLPKQVKLFTDGAIFSQLMQMKDGYTDGHKGAWIMDPPVFGYAFQAYWDAGYQIHIHNNGDAGFDVVLGELEKAMKRAPRKDHRTVLVHFGFAQADQVKRWIKLGGLVSSNPYYVTALAGPYKKIGLGADRAKNIAPHKYVLDEKGSLSFHSDMPMAPAKPLQLVWAGVNRLTYEGKEAGPEHKVPLDVALRAITIDAAYSIRLEKEVGSIEVGKRANLTVLEKDPYKTAAKELKDIPVWGTMLEGRVQPVKATVEKKPAPKPKPKDAPQATAAPESFVAPRGWNTRAKPPACAPGCSCSVGQLFGRHLAVQLEAGR